MEASGRNENPPLPQSICDRQCLLRVWFLRGSILYKFDADIQASATNIAYLFEFESNFTKAVLNSGAHLACVVLELFFAQHVEGRLSRGYCHGISTERVEVAH